MNASSAPTGVSRAPVRSATSSAPPAVVVTAIGGADGSRAAAAALACAGIGTDHAPIFLDLGGPAPRPTLLATGAARALEARLAGGSDHPAAVARGGLCQVALPDSGDGLAAAAAVIGAAGNSAAVLHAPGGRLAALLDGPVAPLISGLLFRSDPDVDRAQAAPLILDLLSRGMALSMLEQRLGWVAERRALFGALRPHDLHELPRAAVRWLADYAASLAGGGADGRG